MDINPNNFLTIQEVLADVLVNMNDEDQRLLTPGFYRIQVKYALDELGFDTMFYEVVEDEELSDDLIHKMPIGCYNLNDIKIYTGTPDNVGYVTNVYWRRNAKTRGKNTGVTANINLGNATDPFINAPFWTSGAAYWFTVQNGLIYLSDGCENHDYVRFTYNGIPSKRIDDVKMIPPETRKGIVLWTTEKCAGGLKSRDPKYRGIQVDAAAQLDEYGYNGAWHEAKMRLRELDKKKLHDILEYNAKMKF